MLANVSGPCMSLWAFGGQLSGSQLSNASVTINTDVCMQLESSGWYLDNPETACP